MGRFTKRFLTGLVITLVLVIGALLIAPQFIPVEVYKKQIIAQGEAATGRTLAINGDISLRFLPDVSLLVQDVHLSNPKDFGKGAEEDMLSLKELRLSIGLFDLLDSRLIVKEFELVDPVIALRKNAKGEGNWVFTPAKGAETTAAAASKESGEHKLQLQVPALSISNGLFTYAEPGKETLRLSKLDAKVEAPALTSPATLTADAVYGENLPLKLIAHIKTPQQWLDGQETQVALEATVASGDALTDASFDGKAQQSKEGKISASGKAQAGSASLKALGKALGITILPDSLNGKGNFRFEANVAYDDPKIALENLGVKLNENELTGKASLNLGGNRPSITAVLASSDVLELDALLAPSSEGGAATSAPAAAPAAAAPASEGWSDAPILADTAFLDSANADVKLSIAGLRYEKLSAGAMNIHTSLQQGKLAVNIPSFDFYEGKAQITVSLAAPTKTPVLSKQVTLSGINVGKFLSESQGFEKLEGKGDVALNINTAGVSMKDFISRLQGNGSLKMADGAIKGINIAETVRNARTLLNGQAQDADAATGAKTDFSELGASFTIAQGIVTNNDLNLKAPLLTLTGQGTVDLPAKRVDYRLRPTLVTTLEGQGRTAEATNALTIPLKVTGTFDKLRFRPDLEDTVKNTLREVLQDPKNAKENLKQDLKDIKSGLKGLLKGM